MAATRPALGSLGRKVTVEDFYLLGLALASCAVRLWVVLDFHPPRFFVFSDMQIYWSRGDSLASGVFTRETAFTPLGYPAFLALCGWLFDHARKEGAGIVQAVLAGFTPVLVHLIARRLARPVFAFAASMATALHVPLIVYTGFFLTESLFAFTICLFAWLCMVHASSPRWWSALFAAATFTYAAALRPSLLLFLVVSLPWIVRAARRRDVAMRPILLAIAMVALLAATLSAVARRPLVIATNGGINIYLSVCECRGVMLSRGREVLGVTAAYNRRHFTDMVNVDAAAEDDTFFEREALGLVAREPARVLRTTFHLVDGLGLGKTGAFPDQPYWPGLPRHDTLMGLYGRLPFVFAWAPALVGLSIARLRRRELPFGLQLLARLTLSILPALLFFAGDPRVRVSMDPIAMACAACVLDRLARTPAST